MKFENGFQIVLAIGLTFATVVTHADERRTASKLMNPDVRKSVQIDLSEETIKPEFLEKIVVKTAVNSSANDCDVTAFGQYVEAALPGAPYPPTPEGFLVSESPEECAELMLSGALDGRCDELASQMSSALQLDIPLEGYVAGDGSCGCTCPTDPGATTGWEAPQTGDERQCANDLINYFEQSSSWAGYQNQVSDNGTVVLHQGSPSDIEGIDLEGRCSWMAQSTGLNVFPSTFEHEGTTYFGCQCSDCVEENLSNLRRVFNGGHSGGNSIYNYNGVKMASGESECSVDLSNGGESWTCPDFEIEFEYPIDTESTFSSTPLQAPFLPVTQGEKRIYIGYRLMGNTDNCPDHIQHPSTMGYSPCKLLIQESDFYPSGGALPTAAENLLINIYDEQYPGGAWNINFAAYDDVHLQLPWQGVSPDMNAPLTACQFVGSDGWLLPDMTSSGAYPNYSSGWMAPLLAPPMVGKDVLCLQQFENTGCEASDPGCGTWVGTYQLQCQ